MCQRTARFDGLEWTRYVDKECRYYNTLLWPSLESCGLCIFCTGQPLCRFFSSCLRWCWRQLQVALLEPHVIFRTEICLGILKKSTAIQVDLFKVQLQSLVAIVLVFVDSCFFLVTGFGIGTTSMVFWGFIVGHGCKLLPGCANSEVEAFSDRSSSLSLAASSAKEKSNMKPHIS